MNKNTAYILRHVSRPETGNHEGFVEIFSKSTHLRESGSSGKSKKISLESFESSAGSEAHSSMDMGRFSVRWWKNIRPVYSFTDRKVAKRLVTLVGTATVDIFDPGYMKKLKDAIAKDFVKKQQDRIRVRKAQEVKRQQQEILTMETYSPAAEKIMRNHPVYKILRKSRKALSKKPEPVKFDVVSSSTRSDVGSTRFREIKEAPKVAQKVCNPDADPEEDIAKGFMLTDEELLLQKYEDRRIYEKLIGKSVKDLYKNAEDIIGTRKNEKNEAPAESSEFDT